MTIKRILSIILVLATLATLCIISSTNTTAKEFTDSYNQLFAYATYEEEGKTKVAIGDWKYDDITSIVIPSHIDGYPVTMILEHTFKDRNFTKVTLPDTLEYIGEAAFWNCPITEVNIPENLKYLAYDAFGSKSSCLKSYTVNKNSKYFKSIDGVLYTKDGKTLVKYPDGKKDNIFDIPKGVEYIYNGAFFYAKNLQKVNLPQSLVAVNKMAFFFAGLESFHITENLQYIGEEAFHYCENLKKITVDENAYPYIENYIFNGTPWLDENQKIGEPLYINHLLYYMNPVVYGTKVIEVREGTKYICPKAFEVFHSEAVLKIPASMEYIPVDSFTQVTSLGGFDVHKNNKYYASVNNMLYTKDKKTLLVAPTIKDIMFTLPENTETIFGNPFGRRLRDVQDLIIPASVTYIDDNAFSTTEIQKYTFLGNIHYCGNNIFNDELVTISLPEGATMIGVDDLKNTQWYRNRDNGFLRQNNVILGYKGNIDQSTLTFPEGVTSVGKKAFYGTVNIQEVILPNDMVAIGPYAFASCQKLNEITIPASVDEIGAGAFGFNITFDNETGVITNYQKVEGFVIKGYTNSLAESYADANDIDFVSIGYIDPESTLLGDLDCDGKLTVKDATALQKYIAAMIGLNSQDKINADFNGDGKINVRDATAIQKRLAKLD